MKEHWKIAVVAGKDFREMLVKVLPKDCEVESLPDDSRLLENIAKASPDLIFLNLREPNSYTFSLTREIKLVSPQTMVIVVGEMKTPDIPLLAFRSKAYDMISCPASEQELKERAQNALLRKKMGVSKTSQEQLPFSVVHQIRNPLGAISGHVQQLLRTLDKLPKKQIDEGLHQILSSCIRIEQSLNEFLNLQRGIAQERALLDINTVVESALALLVYRIEQKKVRVEKFLAASLPYLRGNSKTLLEAFINFITNSIEAMQEGGKLTVETKAQEGYKGLSGKWISVGIKDTGCGIKEEDIPRIFIPFFTTKGADNIGLGLSIGKEIVESHHGHIEVHSNVAKGTEFCIYLPAGEG